MRLRAVLTDLDGTLLEPDGSLSTEARAALDALHAAGVPVVPITSKTRVELLGVMRELGASHGVFENGAGIVSPSGVLVAPGAIAVARLRASLDELVRRGAPVTPLDGMDDAEISRATGLDPARASAARAREYDTPFLAPGIEEAELRRLVAAVDPGLRLVAGGRFWHLLGRHDKKEAAARVVEDLPPGGVTVGLGDAPNDDFLEATDVAVIVPRDGGPDAELVRRLPGARIAPRPRGSGWAAAMMELLAEEG
jgi:mannosyl-3-phosphoglycerate phosphatase